MKDHTNILCYGCTAETLAQLEAALPSPTLHIEETDSATDLIAVPCLTAVIAPDALNNTDAAMLADYYREVPEEAPILTAPCPEFERAGLHCRLFPKEKTQLQYLLLQQVHTEKKSVHFYNSIVDALRVLKEIHQHPGTTTKELAAVIERNERTALRYIHSLSAAGELIAYDQEKHGWYLMNGYSSLMEDAMLHHSPEELRFTSPSPEVAFCSSLQENEWDWELWYWQSLSALRELTPTQQGDESFYFLWYSMAETLKSITSGDDQQSICCDLLGDLMRRLTGRNDYCNEIMLDVLQKAPRYEELMQRFRFSMSAKSLGSFWREWGLQHTSQECIALLERLLPFWCWHEAYTLRFAECWAEQFHESEKIDTSPFGMKYSEDCLRETAETMQAYRRTPLQKLLTIPPIAVWEETIRMDAEDVLLLFLRSNMPPQQAFRLTHRVIHAMKLTEAETNTLQQSCLPVLTKDSLLCRKYIPSRRKAAGKLMHTMMLYPTAK